MNKSISKYLTELRIERNLTQLELGKKLGMSRSKVSSWEIGRRDISISDAVIITNFFNISLDHLLNPDHVTSGKVKDICKLYLENNKISSTEKEKTIGEIDEDIEKILDLECSRK